MQPEGYGPTVRHVTQSQQPPLANSRALIAIVVGIALIVGLAVGVLVGRATSAVVTAATTVAASSEAGILAVASKPADGNVVVDGRFVGVAPIERLDLEPGKHSVVIDAFGYQPYSGTLEIEAHGKVNLSVLLAPLGVDDATTGNVTGGVAKRAVVQRSALVPAGGGSAAPAAPTAPAPDAKHKPAHDSPPPRVAAPPPRPRRDCSGEKSTCENNCRHAQTDCDFSCPGCSSCNTSVGWDECNRQCAACKQGCKGNVTFCESGCSTSYSSCQDSQ